MLLIICLHERGGYAWDVSMIMSLFLLMVSRAAIITSISAAYESITHHIDTGNKLTNMKVNVSQGGSHSMHVYTVEPLLKDRASK